MEIEILDNGTYIVDGTKATRGTLAATAARFHKDLSYAERNRVLNIHIIKPEIAPLEEVQFIFDALWDYGFHRLVTGNQEVVRSKGNTPFANEPNIMQTHYSKANEGQVISEMNITLEQQTSASRDEMREYTKLAKKYNAMPKEERVVKLKDLKRLEYIYNKMSPKQKADAEPFPECIPPPPPPPPAPDAPKAVNLNSQVPNPPQPPQPDGVKDSQVPPPPPPTFEVSEFISQGAKFYLNDKVISNAKAKQLAKNLDALKTINVKKGKDGKLKVHFRN